MPTSSKLQTPAPLPRMPMWALRGVTAIKRHGSFTTAVNSLVRDYSIPLNEGIAVIQNTVRGEWLTAPGYKLTPQTITTLNGISSMRGASRHYEGAPTQALEDELSVTEVALLTSLDQPGPIRNDLWRGEGANVSDLIGGWLQRGLVQASEAKSDLSSSSALRPLDLVVIADSQRAPIEALLADVNQQLDDLLHLPELHVAESIVGRGSVLPI